MPGSASLGAKLRAARKIADMKVPEVAKALGVSPSAVYNWETDIHEPNASQLLILCRLYGIDLADLYDELRDLRKRSVSKWEAKVDLRTLLADIMRKHPEAYPIQVKDDFADAQLAIGDYAIVDPDEMNTDPGKLYAVSIAGEYPIFAYVTWLPTGIKLSPASHNPANCDQIIDFEEGGDAEVLAPVIWSFPSSEEHGLNN